VQEGLISPLAVDPGRVSDALAIARRDLEVARTPLSSISDWAFTVAYNAILQGAGRYGSRRDKGYRPAGSNPHSSVVRFCEEFLSRDDAEWFERMRRKQHQSVYDSAGLVSGIEAGNVVKKAEKILHSLESLSRV
jgi:hypothetical protein